MKIITVLLLLEIFSAVSSIDFQNPNVDGVEYDDTKSPVQVTVEESNSGGKITILQIVDAEDKPQITPLFGAATRLAPEIVQQSGQYVLKVEQLDYESLVKDKIDPSFLFIISDSKTSKSVNLNIKNLDDESPSLEAITIRCEMMEETVIDVENSKCIFEVSDPDGWLNSMTFTVLVEDSPDILLLEYATSPDDKLQKTYMYLVLQMGETFDFEVQQTYNLTIDAKDAAGHSIGQKLDTIVTVTDKPPVWMLFPNLKHIKEEAEASFQIIAIDPDKDYPNKIIYDLASSSSSVRIDKKTGLISIGKIDGDIISSLSLSVTAKYNNSFSYASTTGEIALQIDDIDDNIPKIEKTVDILEISLSRDEYRIFSIVINDKDVDGENSAYSINVSILDDVRSSIDFTPKIGSHRTTVNISIDAVELYRKFPDSKVGMQLSAIGINNPSRNDSWIILASFEDEKSSGVQVGVSWVIATVLTCTMMLDIIWD